MGWALFEKHESISERVGSLDFLISETVGEIILVFVSFINSSYVSASGSRREFPLGWKAITMYLRLRDISSSE
jgi:hypothetical protein